MRIEHLTFDLKAGKWSAPFPAMDSSKTWVLSFGDPSVIDKQDAVKQLRNAYPTALHTGCSGSGEIVGTEVRDDVLAVAIVKFDHTFVAAVSAECKGAGQSFAVGEALAKRLNKPMLRSVFVLSDGLNVNGSELVRGLNSVLDESVIVTGGLAGDGTRFQKTWVSLNDSVSSGVVVAVGFYGDHLLVAHGSKGGWDKFGPERVVTRAEGNVLYELDGRPALSIYKEYLGEKASGLPATGLLFPLSLRANVKDDKALVRTLLAVDEAKQSMTFAGDIPLGYLAQLMKADFDRLIGGAATAATTARKLVQNDDPNTLAIAVSCVGRRLVLGERTEEEVEAVMDVLPKGARIAGFYSYGELSPWATGRCDLHNQTMTLTTMSESPTPVLRRKPVASSTSGVMARPSAPPAAAAVPVATRATTPGSGPLPAVKHDDELDTNPGAPTPVRGMRHEHFTCDLKTGKWSAAFPDLDSPRTWVLAFGDPALIDKPSPLRELRRAYPNSTVIGCSGAGEIVGTEVRDDVLAVSVIKFDQTNIGAAQAECKSAANSFQVGETLAKKLNRPQLRAVFVLSDGLNVNGSDLVRGLNSVLDESVIVTGGLAGDGTRFQRTWVALNDVIASGLVVAIGFYGDHLLVAHGSKGGWDKFGPERVVTRAENNVLYELDGRPALSIYKEYLGDKASGLPATGLLFPLSLRANAKDDKALVRTLLAVDEAKQSMTFAGDIPSGYLAQFMKADFDRLIGGAATAATTARKMVTLDDPNTLAIAVSCVGRRLVLGERTEEEVEAVMDVLPRGSTIAGFYSYGELSPWATGRCDLHNQTMTLTTFNESVTPVARPAPLPAQAALKAPEEVQRVARPVPSAPARPAAPASIAAPAAKPSPAPAAQTIGVFEDLQLDSESAFRPIAATPGKGLRIEHLTFDLKTGKWSAPFPELDSARTWVLAFGDPAVIDKPASFRELKKAFPLSLVTGCSGAGEIVGTDVRDDVLSVTITRFDQTSTAAASAECKSSADSFQVGETLAKKLNKPLLRSVFVLSDGLNVNGSDLVRGLNSVLDESVIVTGGLAGDGTRFQRTWVALNDVIASGLVVAVGFYGDHLSVAHGSKGGWDKFGPERVVTRAENNVLYELDGRPALSIYKEYLGDKASGLPATGLLFPLSLRANTRDDKALVRTLLAVDEAKQSMTFAGDIPSGYLAQFMKADFDRLIGGAATAATTARKMVTVDDPNTLAIAVSCVGRRLVLGERTEEEVEAVMDVLPRGSTIAGFYSYGELSPWATGRCDLHNQTMTLTTFTESAHPVPRLRPTMPSPVPSTPLTVPMPSAPPPPASSPRLDKLEAALPLMAIQTVPTALERRVTRPHADRSPAAGATIEVTNQGDVTTVTVKGKLSETFQGRQVSAPAKGHVLFDLAQVERVTSFGVREWLQMLTDLEAKHAKLYLARCSEAVVNQLGMIRRFSGGGKVLSFFAPYRCEACGSQFSAMLDCAADAEAIGRKSPPTVDCPSCEQPAHFDDDPRSYLSFAPPPVSGLSEDIKRAIDALPRIGVQDPIEKSIEGRTNRVRLNCRVDESVRWDRVLDGVEGEVVIDLTGSPGVTTQGLTVMMHELRSLPSDVEAVRFEAAGMQVLEALNSGAHEPRFGVLSAAIEGFCPKCSAKRPALLRFSEAVTTMREGKDPYVTCKRCTSALDFANVRPLLLALDERSRARAPSPVPAPAPAAATPSPAPSAPPRRVTRDTVPLPSPTLAPRQAVTPMTLVAIGLGIAVVLLVGFIALRPAQPLVITTAPAQPAPAAPTPPPAPVVTTTTPAAETTDLPPAWSEHPVIVEGDAVYIVGRASGAASEETALARARVDAELRLVQYMLDQLAGTPTHEFVNSSAGDDIAANAEPIASRYERQLGAVASPQRTDAQLKRKAGGLDGFVRYRVTREGYEKALDFYRASVALFGATVARFFPTLEASLRTEGELVVVSAGHGFGARAGLRDGDVLLQVAGHPVTTVDGLTRVLRENSGPGNLVTALVESGGVKRTLKFPIPSK